MRFILWLWCIFLLNWFEGKKSNYHKSLNIKILKLNQVIHWVQYASYIMKLNQINYLSFFLHFWSMWDLWCKGSRAIIESFPSVIVPHLTSAFHQLPSKAHVSFKSLSWCVFLWPAWRNSHPPRLFSMAASLPLQCNTSFHPCVLGVLHVFTSFVCAVKKTFIFRDSI